MDRERISFLDSVKPRNYRYYHWEWYSNEEENLILLTMIKIFHGVYFKYGMEIMISRLSSYYDHVFKYTHCTHCTFFRVDIKLARNTWIIYFILLSYENRTGRFSVKFIYLITLQNTKDRYTIKLLSTRRSLDDHDVGSIFFLHS